MVNGTEYEQNSENWKESKRLLLIVVTTAMFVDFMLVSTIVPIVPPYLIEIRNSSAADNHFARSRAIITTETPENRGNSSHSLSRSSAAVLSHQKSEEGANKINIFQWSADIGFLFGSKSFVQLLVNPIIGPITDKVGYRRPLFTGSVILFLSALLFALGHSYLAIFLARSFQGIGSSCIAVAGMGALATRFTDEKKKAQAIKIAIAGSSLGVMFGPPFGGFMYHLFGKEAPFLVLCILALINGGIQLCMRQPERKKNKIVTEGSPSSIELLADPYILVAAVGMLLVCAGFAFYEFSLPIWMMDTIHPSSWELGIVFFPSLLGFVLVLNILEKFFMALERWLVAIVGMILSGICLVMVPFSASILRVALQGIGLGIGFGMIELALMPEFAHLVDIRHVSVYENVYVLVDFVQGLGLSLGPICGGVLMKYVSFKTLMISAAIIFFAFAPFLYFLRNPPRLNRNVDQSYQKAMAHNEIPLIEITQTT